MRIGIIKEEKQPVDRRVPLPPAVCKALVGKNKDLEIVVQSSEERSFSDQEYQEAGIEVVQDVSDCDVLMGVKEVPVDKLIPNKKYFFFSHTIKKQEYNRKLLQTVLEKNIQLIDYECLTDEDGFRIIGFGKYAGIVGGYNAIRAYGLREKLFELKPANQCKDKAELFAHLKSVVDPAKHAMKIVITGGGRVATGVLETMEAVDAMEVFPEELLSEEQEGMVYTQLFPDHYYRHTSKRDWDIQDLIDTPGDFESIFTPYTKKADVYISGHFWNPKSPVMFTKEDIQAADFSLKVIADITCDIDGSVPTTIRSTTIEDPLFGYNKESGEEVGAFEEGAVTIMAVDNLPCELPRDASMNFGIDLYERVILSLIKEDSDQIIERATIAKDGKLMPDFEYLRGYVED